MQHYLGLGSARATFLRRPLLLAAAAALVGPRARPVGGGGARWPLLLPRVGCIAMATDDGEGDGLHSGGDEHDGDSCGAPGR